MLPSQKIHTTFSVVVVTLAALVLACTDSTDPNSRVHITPGTSGYGRVTSVQLKSPPASLEEGARASLVCMVMDSRGVILDASKSWRVADTSLAAVSAAGLFVARRPGTALVTCSADGVSATAAIGITASVVDFVDVTPGGSELMIGNSVQLIGVARDATGDAVPNHPVQWSTDNAAVASVSSTGAVTAYTEGTATITASTGSKTGTASLSVSSGPPAPVAAITLAISDPTLNIGQTTRVDATLTDASGRKLQNRSITWSVADPSIAAASTLNANSAKVIAKLTGTTQIIATCEGISAGVALTVAPPAVQSVTVTLGSSTLYPQKTTQAVATLKDANGNVLSNRVVTWKSLNTAIAVVSASGLVTALAPGSAYIRATSEGKSSEAALTVQAPPTTGVTVGAVSVALASTSITQGQQSQAYAIVTDSSGAPLNGQTVAWSSSDDAVATVSSSGIVTGKAAGVAKIRAAAQSKVGEATETVMAPTLPVAYVTVTLASNSVTVGQSTQATAVPKDLNGFVLTGRTVTWSSLTPNVASVSASGLVSAIATGSATIRATVESTTGDAALSATAVPIANISVSLASSSLATGQTTQATAVAKDANGATLTGRTMTWSSSNPAVATVSSSGVVTAVGGGTASIRAAAEGLIGEAQLSVASPVPVATVSVTLTSSSLSAGQTTQASFVAKDAGGTTLTGRTVAWSSLNPTIATVSPTGLVTAVSGGTATIRATVESKTGDAPLTVTASTVSVATVSVTLAAPGISVGQSTQATAVARDANGNALTGRVVAWSSLNTGVATVSSSGLVTAVAIGSATIRATVETKTGDAAVAVSAGSTIPTGTLAQLLPSTGGCLRAGTPVTVPVTCSTTDTATRFVVPDANVNGAIGALSKCLADSAGVSVILASCDGSSGQQWKRAGYTGTITHVASGKCLASSAGRVVFYTCGSDAFAAWTTEPIQSGSGGGGGGGGTTPPPSTCTSADSAVARLSHPNEPSGMTTLHTHAGLTVKPCGWFDASGNVSVVSDPEKGNVLQLSMAGTTTPGSGTARLDAYPEIGSFGATKLYVAFWEKLSPGFKGNNGSGSLKNIIVHTQATYGGLPNSAIHLPALINDPTNVDGRIRIFDSFVNVTDFDGRHHDPANNDQALSPDAGDILSRGNWHFIECLVELNSRGQINGTVKTWVDGVLVASATGIKAVYDGTLRITGIELTNVWGGGGTAIAADNYYRFKDIYVSGGFARAGERPDHWVITPLEGTSVAAGSDVHITAQLVDANGNPVDVCGLQPKFSVTGGATWDYWSGAGVYDNYTGCEHGRQMFTLHTSKVVGTQHVITVEDYGTVFNGATGDRRTGVSAAITVR